MALVKEVLKTAIVKAFNDQRSKDNNPEGAIDNLADQLATAIDAYIKSGVVTTTVTGSSATGGPVTGSGTGNIS